MPRYLVSIVATSRAAPAAAPLAVALTGRRVVMAPCAQAAACDLASAYISAGLLVEWKARRTGARRLGPRWEGQFVPGDDDGLAGVREPRRPAPSAGSMSAAAEPEVT